MRLDESYLLIVCRECGLIWADRWDYREVWKCPRCLAKIVVLDDISKLKNEKRR